jgi:secreted PhoX family phosphatase
MRKKTFGVICAGVLIVALGATTVLAAFDDFGSSREQQLKARALQLFGVAGSLDTSSSKQLDAAAAAADPASLVTLAQGLTARVVSANTAGASIDMIALWPNEVTPTHLVACNEQGTAQPGVQRITIATGLVETILTGTDDCDGVRRSAWGTILFSEEAGGGANGGRTYELIDPLNTTGVILDRATGTVSGGIGASNLAVRPALGRLSFEGSAVYASGLTYYGDENRPSSGAPGGAYFKFVPSTLYHPANGPMGDLAQSPYVSGSIFGLRLGKRSGSTDYGQGTQYGFGTWVPICSGADCNDKDLRAQTASLKLTGYYRPEDMDIDRAAEAAGDVHFCAPNTGNEGNDQLYGEVICVTDGSLAQAAAGAAKPEAQLLVQGSPAIAMPDNIAYQSSRGNWIVHEDADTEHLSPHNNDLWDCLPDLSDPDQQSDGCIRIGTLNDLTAEWTGGIFDATSTRFFVSVQHNVTGHAVVLEINGWK